MHYRRQADRDTYGVLGEKTGGQPWQLPPGFGIDPDSRSRFYEPTSPVDPMLPIPRAQLSAYSLPDLPTRDPRRFRGSTPSQAAATTVAAEGTSAADMSPRASGLPSAIRLTEYAEPLPPGTAAKPAGAAFIGDLAPPPAPERTSAETDERKLSVMAEQFRLAPVPEFIWDSLPAGCRMRMFEFPSLREEYRRTYGREPTAAERDRSPKLALEDIVEAAQINSREYQTKKETLYTAALRLTLERFAYDLKFAVGGSTTSVDYTQSRDGGVTENGLSIPTKVTADKVLATGGNLLARFANDVVLTFNGPDGFTADIGSELLCQLSQSVFQRDVVFENLTQAERNVVYAARTFARYRKTLFSNLANQYYNLLLAYRRIEVDGMDYFGNLRGFYRAEAENQAGRLPRFQVDQFEQSSLTSRSTLITDYNTLERSLDNLKLQVGLPPELPLNLDLAELEQLTLRDETTAAAERVRRARRNLQTERQQAVIDRDVLLNLGLDLAGKMLRLMELRETLDHPQPEKNGVQQLRDRLSVQQAELEMRQSQAALAKEQQPTPPAPAAPPLRIFQRALDVIDATLTFGERCLESALRETPPPAWATDSQTRARTFHARLERIRLDLETIVKTRALDRIPELVTAAKQLLADADQWAAGLQPHGAVRPKDDREAQQQTLTDLDRTLADSERLLAADVGGLTPVEIDMDDAMLTALTQRFDLMNQRGDLADRWRRIKLAADDLKSILNLQATQSVRTRSDVNRPFDFTFDDSDTRLRLTVDAPFNRRAQRNQFRQSLINYNQGLRSLIALEDGIKLAVRDDLRQLQQNQEQYRIAVSGAALAYERLITTRLQLVLGVQKVTARDVLESQQAYTNALNSMARAHVTYLLERIDLFMDLELLTVDANGFWTQVYDENHQPAPSWELPPHARPVYDELPRGLWYSRAIRRMLEVPTGQTRVYATDGSAPRGTERDAPTDAPGPEPPPPPPPQ